MCAGSVLPSAGTTSTPAVPALPGAARSAVCKASRQRASAVSGPWPLVGLRKSTLGCVQGDIGVLTSRTPASLRWTRLPSTLPANEFPAASSTWRPPLPLSRGPGRGQGPPSLTPPVFPASPSRPGEAAQRAPLGGAGAGGVGVTSLPISDDREKQGEPVTGAEARRGADGPPNEPRLDRGRRGEGGREGLLSKRR